MRLLVYEWADPSLEEKYLKACTSCNGWNTIILYVKDSLMILTLYSNNGSTDLTVYLVVNLSKNYTGFVGYFKFYYQHMNSLG